MKSRGTVSGARISQKTGSDAPYSIARSIIRNTTHTVRSSDANGLFWSFVLLPRRKSLRWIFICRKNKGCLVCCESSLYLAELLLGGKKRKEELKIFNFFLNEDFLFSYFKIVFGDYISLHKFYKKTYAKNISLQIRQIFHINHFQVFKHQYKLQTFPTSNYYDLVFCRYIVGLDIHSAFISHNVSFLQRLVQFIKRTLNN